MMAISAFFLLVLIPHAASLTFDLKEITQRNLNIDIVVAGDASVSNEGIQLTPYDAKTYKAGRATYIDLLHLWDKASGELASFHTSFSFVITMIPLVGYGEGLTFFLAQNNTVITNDGALGLPVDPTTYNKRNPFVAVEFDTNQNTITSDQTYQNHVGIDVNSLTSVTYQIWNTNIVGGQEYVANIRYDSVIKALNVSVTTVGSVLKLSHQVDLREYLPEWVIFGFTAATGRYIQRNTVTSWSFDSSNLRVDEEKAPPPITTPEIAVKGKGKNRIGLIVGLVAGGLLFVVVFSVIFAIYLRRRKNTRDEVMAPPSPREHNERDDRPVPIRPSVAVETAFGFGRFQRATPNA